MYVQALLCSCSTMGTSQSHDSTLLSLYMSGCVGRSSQPVASSVASNKAQAPLCRLRATPCETLALPLPLLGPQGNLILSAHTGPGIGAWRSTSVAVLGGVICTAQHCTAQNRSLLPRFMAQTCRACMAHSYITLQQPQSMSAPSRNKQLILKCSG